MAGATGRAPALDGIRAIAVLMVVALHAGYVAHPPGHGLARSYFPGGFAGVDVFFVLSGFLITTLLLKEHMTLGRVSFPKFYARRALRLFPALAALLLFDLIYALQQGHPMVPEVKAIAAIAFYVSNFTQAFHYYMPAELVHTWTLAVEEQFYLVWPAALAIILAIRARRPQTTWLVPVVLVSALVITNVTQVVVWRTQGYPEAYVLPYCHAHGLVIGAMLAFAHQQGRAPRKGAEVAGWIGLIFLLGFTVFWFHGGTDANSIYYGGDTILALASAAVINAVMVGSPSLTGWLSWRPMVAIGRVSYGLYLWHALVLTILIDHHLGLPRLPRTLVGLLISAAATIISWVLVERPALRLKDRFTSTPSATITTPGHS